MRDKYGISEEGPFMFKSKQRESGVWNGIVWSSNLLRSGLRWRIGNRMKASFWLDKWLGDFRLLEWSDRQISGN